MANYYLNAVPTADIPYNPQAQVVFGRVTVKVTAEQMEADETVINIAGPFPAGAVVANAADWLFTLSDLDTNATPTLAIDFQFSAAAAGTSPDEVINDSAAGQTGTTDRLDGAEGGTDIAGKYLQALVKTVAATGADGTIAVQYAYRTQPPLKIVDLTSTTGVAI